MGPYVFRLKCVLKLEIVECIKVSKHKKSAITKLGIELSIRELISSLVLKGNSRSCEPIMGAHR